MCFGIGVAAKYPFGLSGVAILGHALVYRHAKWWEVIAWGLLSIVVFFIFNPYLYPAPLERVRAQLEFHEAYAERQEGAQVMRPIRQLTYPGQFLPDQFDIPLKHWLDVLLFALAVIGLPPTLTPKIGLWLVVSGGHDLLDDLEHPMAAT